MGIRRDGLRMFSTLARLRRPRILRKDREKVLPGAQGSPATHSRHDDPAFVGSSVTSRGMTAYFFFFFLLSGACVRADLAALFAAFVDFGSRSTFPAFEAARFPVFSFF